MADVPAARTITNTVMITIDSLIFIFATLIDNVVSIEILTLKYLKLIRTTDSINPIHSGIFCAKKEESGIISITSRINQLHMSFKAIAIM